jgi:hypothetical protein
VGDTIGRSISGALALRLGSGWLRLFALIIIVLINVHMTGSWLVMFRALSALSTLRALNTLLLWRLRHARQWWLCCHGGKRWWVVSSL